jgi:hypothetical protein
MMGTLWLPAGCKPLPGQRVDWDAYKPAIQRPSLELWLNDGCGALVNDASGNGNHGIFVSDWDGNPPIQWIPGEHGMGVVNGGGTTYISIPAKALSCVEQTFSVFASIVPNSTSDYLCLLQMTAAKNNQNLHIELDAGKMSWLLGGASWRSRGATVMTLGKSYNCLWTHSPSGVTEYLNGIRDGGSADYVTVQPINWVSIGYSNLGNFTGLLHNIVIWNADIGLAGAQALQGPVPIWVPQRYFDLAAGGAQEVAGAATGTLTAAGQALVNRILAGAGVGTLSSSAALLVSHILAGGGTGSLSATGAALVAHILAGTGAGALTADGQPLVTHVLTGAGTGALTASGQPLVAHPVGGSGTGALSAEALLLVNRLLAGAVAGTLTAQGQPLVDHPMGGAAEGSFTASALLLVNHILGGGAVGVLTATGALVVVGSGELSGAAVGTLSATAALLVDHALAGGAVAALTADGALSLSGGAANFPIIMLMMENPR